MTTRRSRPRTAPLAPVALFLLLAPAAPASSVPGGEAVAIEFDARKEELEARDLAASRIRFAPAALAPAHSPAPPVGGDEAIRRRLREVHLIRNYMLEASQTSRYAFHGKLELLRFDCDRRLRVILDMIARYRQLIDQLCAMSVKAYRNDPGTWDALQRAIRWGERTAMAVPHYHRLGYARIQPLLDGPLDLTMPATSYDR